MWAELTYYDYSSINVSTPNVVCTGNGPVAYARTKEFDWHDVTSGYSFATLYSMQSCNDKSAGWCFEMCR